MSQVVRPMKNYSQEQYNISANGRATWSRNTSNQIPIQKQEGDVRNINVELPTSNNTPVEANLNMDLVKGQNCSIGRSIPDDLPEDDLLRKRNQGGEDKNEADQYADTNFRKFKMAQIFGDQCLLNFQPGKVEKPHALALDLKQVIKSNAGPTKAEAVAVVCNGNLKSKSTDRSRKMCDAFSNLHRFLRILFIEQNSLKRDMALNFQEMAILTAVIEKKIGCKIETKNIYALDELLVHKNQTSRRRAEECYKLVFKQVFKHLQTKFENANSEALESKPQQVKLIEFYKYYFAAAALSERLSIESFFLPLTADSKDLNTLNVSSKTINSTYISVITKSRLFVYECLQYLKEDFFTDYINQTARKISKIVGKWGSVHAKSFCGEKAIEYICDYIANNRKSKLPWFYQEVEYAVELVKRIVIKNEGRSELIKLI